MEFAIRSENSLRVSPLFPFLCRKTSLGQKTVMWDNIWEFCGGAHRSMVMVDIAPGDLPNPGIKPASPAFFFTTEPPGNLP